MSEETTLETASGASSFDQPDLDERLVAEWRAWAVGAALLVLTWLLLHQGETLFGEMATGTAALGAFAYGTHQVRKMGSPWR